MLNNSNYFKFKFKFMQDPNNYIKKLNEKVGVQAL